MQFRKHFGYDVEKASDEATVPVTEEYSKSLTVQSQTEDTDINVIMHRYGVTHKLPENPRVPTFGDFSGVRDFRSAMDAVVAAEDAFMEFPASVRARFDNDPQAVLDFVSNESNYEEAIKLGLMKEGAKAPTPVTPQPQAAASGAGAPAGAPGGAGAPAVT